MTRFLKPPNQFNISEDKCSFFITQPHIHADTLLRPQELSD